MEKPDDQPKAGDDCQHDEPEPKDDVNLLVDDVHPEDAHGVKLLDRSRTSELVEDALGNPGEHFGHGVHSVFYFNAWPVENFSAIVEKGSSEEHVCEEDLSNNVHKIENLAKEETSSPKVGI